MQQGQGKKFYLGIDLGTTNSVMAWGVLDPRTNTIDTKVVPIRMLTARGYVNSDLLSSCVYFRDKDNYVVGEEAKEYVGLSDNVAVSIKSQMGTSYTMNVNGKPYTPSTISAFILKQIAQSATKLLGFLPEDVIITVPASFDPDQRAATLKAAEEAGFQLKNKDGSDKNILLNEPRAALYDFTNRLARGEIPETLIDFSQTKKVLVFDLGGGTLDVSLHEVRKELDSFQVKIEDLAVSRYTQVGGDNFDQLLAEQFYAQFEPKLRGKSVSETQQKLLQSRFRKMAEEAKISLSSEIDNMLFRGATNLSDIEVDVAYPYLHDDLGFDTFLTVDDYEEAVACLLANELTLDSLDDFDSITDTENIIYPILDVLQKAKDRLNEMPQVDVVLLNGGMTKLYSIQQRLERLFGFAPTSAGDPDKAVARGAAVYHYLLEGGFIPNDLLNETVGLELSNDYVMHLLAAGTALPSPEKILDNFSIPQTGAMLIELPFYLGRRQDTQHPNRKIATRTIHFDRMLPGGTPLVVSVKMERDNTLKLNCWVKDQPDQKFSVDVDTETTEQEIRRSASSETEPERPKQKELPPQSDEVLDIDEQVEEYEKWIRYYESAGSKKVIDFAMKEIKSCEKRISRARNNTEFIVSLLDRVQSYGDFSRGRLFGLLGKIGVYASDSEKTLICDTLIDVCIHEMRYGTMASGKASMVVAPAIDTIGRMQLQMAESFLISLLRGDVLAIRLSAMIALGRSARSVNVLKQLERFLDSEETSERINANWAIGRMSGRDQENPVPAKHLESLALKIQQLLLQEKHAVVVQNGVYALAEIGDRRTKNENAISASHAKALIHALDQLKQAFESDRTVRQTIEFAVYMIEGKQLSEEMNRTLLILRSKLESA